MFANLGTDVLVFMGMVFVAVVLLASSVIVPTVGSEAQANRRMRRRLDSVLDAIDPGTYSLLREQYLKNLSPLERALDWIPGVQSLGNLMRQAGASTPSYWLVVWSVAAGLGGYFFASVLIKQTLVALALGVFAFCIPYLLVVRKRAKRLARFEEQLPEALDMMARALQAGHPFNETLKMVSEEMPDPIAGEFGQVFSDINYGLPIKTAFVSLLSRVPSISLNALVNAVLIQNESGGRIAEILMKIAEVIRSRFRLMRKVRSLSAEGRLSAWILGLLPFVLAVVISITTPDYLPMMIKDPLGIKLVYGAFGFLILGILWMRRIIRFKY